MGELRPIGDVRPLNHQLRKAQFGKCNLTPVLQIVLISISGGSLLVDALMECFSRQFVHEGSHQ